MQKEKKLAIIGLGYVGLPLAVEFAKIKRDVIGFDINEHRIKELKEGVDATLEVSEEEMAQAKSILYTHHEKDLINAQIFIVTVPTPIDEYKRPNLRPLESASRLVGKYLNKGDIVIYESTVFPGCTEEVCVPILESESNLQFNKDFFCGYSPERINPGDKVHRVHNIVKVTSGSTPEVADEVDELYRSIVQVGTHKATSIKVAEAAKVIENAQRDLNISFVNELALIFDRLDIDTLEVLEAAGTKWNFLPFKPGLVGGHCISVDPFYLTHKAESVGYNPQVILSGRRINDHMGIYIANKVLKLMINKGHRIKGTKALVLGITFKENCPDIRNSRVIDVIRELKSFGMQVDVHDPHASSEEVMDEYDIDLVGRSSLANDYTSVILAVNHECFQAYDFEDLLANKDSIIYDVKGFLPKNLVTDRL